jgi:hypothetical protein
MRAIDPMHNVVLLLATLLLAGTAVAQTPVSLEDLQPLREVRERSVAERDRLGSEQAALEHALQAVNEAINQRKSQGAVVADAALEGLLRQHRDISDRLTDLSRELRTASTHVLHATQALVDTLDQKLRALRPLTRGRSAAAREARAQLRALLAERARFAVGPVGGGCVLPEVRLAPSDGPEEGRAKINLLQDAEARCRRRIARVEKRLSGLREERKLLQEAADFREEGEIFDEESRRRLQIRVQSAGAPTGEFAAARTSTQPPPQTPAGGMAAGAPAPGTGGTTPGGGTGATPGVGGATATDSHDSNSAANKTATPTESSLSLPDTALTGRRYGSADEEIADLTRQRLDLRRAAERIRKAHDELSKRLRPLTERR